MSSNVVRIDPAPPPDAWSPTNVVMPGCLVSGTPNDRGARQFRSEDRKVAAGVWACDTYHERVPAYEVDELCVVLEGRVTVTESGGDPQSFGTGDAFVIRRGTRCEWDATGPFRKLYMWYDAEGR